MDLNRLSTGEKVLGVSSILLLVLSFFPLWGKYESEGAFGGGSERVGAWNGDAFNILTKLGLILTLLVIILVLAKAAGGLDNVNLPAPLGLIYLILAGLAALLIILTAVIGPREEFGGQNLGDFGVEVSRGPVLYLGALLALAMAAGAFLHFSGGESGTSASRPAGGPPPGPPGT